jgi:hypothetical protein
VQQVSQALTTAFLGRRLKGQAYDVETIASGLIAVQYAAAE